MSSRKATHVYVCETPHGAKIGVSINVPRRALAFGAGTRIVKTWRRPHMDAHAVEYTALRLVGAKPVLGAECFDVPAHRAVYAVERAIEMVDDGRGIASPGTIRERQQEAEMRRFSDEIAKVVAMGKAITEDYERRGYVFDREKMDFVLPGISA